MSKSKTTGKAETGGGRSELAKVKAKLADLERREAERNVAAEASRLLAQASSLFLAREDLDLAIKKVIELCGEFLGADRVRVFSILDRGRILQTSYEWSDAGIDPRKDGLKRIDLGEFAWSLDRLADGKPVVVADTAQLPGSLGVRMTSAGIKSFLIFPVMIDGKLEMFCSVTVTRDAREWSKSDISILRQVAELIGRGTERRRLEEKLRRSLQELDALKRQNDAVLRSTPHGLCLLNSVWAVTWANEAMAQIVNEGGGTLIDLVGKPFAALFPSAEQFDQFKAGVLQSLRRGLPDKREIEIVKFGGRKIWCEISAVRTDPASTAFGLTATVTDVSDRHRAEIALQERERRFHAMVQNSMDMLLVYDAKGLVSYVNPAVERDLGYAPGEMMGKPGWDFVHPDDLGRARKFFGELLAHPGKSLRIEFRVRRKDGQWRDIEGVAANLIADPSVQGIVANSQDITERKAAEKALRDSEALYGSLVGSLTQNVFRKDAEGRFTFVNSHFCAALGKTAEELLGKTDFDLYPEALARKYREDDLRVMRSGVPIEAVERHQQPDGRMLYVEVVKAPIKDGAGNVLGLQGIFWDTTERKESEDRLRESEERYRNFIAGLPIGVFQATPGKPGRFVQANPAMARMFGYDTVEEFLSCEVIDLYSDPENRKRIAAELMAHGQVLDVEVRVKRKDGTLFWARNSVSARRDASGKVRYFDGIIEDIDKRKRAEEELRRSQEQHRGLLENITDGVYEVDLAGNMTYANPAILRLFGYEGGSIIGRNNREYMDAENAKLVFEAFNQVFRSGEPHHGFVYELLSRGGERRTVEGSISLVRDAQEKPIGFRGVVRDISERRRAEKALAEKTLQIERANQDLKRKNMELDEFTYIASHDLQEPLRKLTAFSNILRKDLGDRLPERADKDLGFIIDAAGRMQTLVQDLLQLSRAGKSAMKRERVALRDCAAKAIEALAVRVEGTQAKIEIGDLPEVWGDRTMLTQLFQNLIGNALKFVKGLQPEIRVTAEKDGEQWVIGVQDNGIGIKPEYQQQIFAPFKRLHGRSEYEGSGIGLSICRKSVERHGGRIWVESEPERGSHFKFTIGERSSERGVESGEEA